MVHKILKIASSLEVFTLIASADSNEIDMNAK